MDEELPFGSRGGIAIRHPFPLDGEYVVKIRLQRDVGNFVVGLSEQHEHQLDVRLDGARIKLFTIRGGEPKPADPDEEGAEDTSDAGLETRFPAKAGMGSVAVTFLERNPPVGIFSAQAGGT